MAPRGSTTNLCLQSDRPDLPPWTVSGATVGAYAGPLPSGVASMITLTDSGAAEHYAEQTPSSLDQADIVLSGCVAYVAGSGWICVSADGGASVSYVNVLTFASSAVSAEHRQFQLVFTDAVGVYRWSFQQKLAQAPKIRIYLADTDPKISYPAAGNALAVGGVQYEFALPGQTTPQLYTPSLASPGVGPRDTRQNYLSYSESLPNAWTPNAAVGGTIPVLTGNYALAPDGTMTATRVQFAKTSDAGSFSRIQNARPSGTVGASHAFALWAKTNDGTTKTLSVHFDSSVTLITVTPSWQRFVAIGATTSASPVWQVLLFTNDGTSDTADVCLWGVQVAQTNRMPDYVQTTTGIACPNGAPRSVVL